MDYITPEEFLKQSKNVQKVLREWWRKNVNQYDLFYRKVNNESQKYIVIEVNNYEIVTIDLKHKYPLNVSENQSTSIDRLNIQFIDDIVPLFTEPQLRNFIEEKTGACNIFYIGYTNNVTSKSNGITLESKNTDMLNGYWQKVCKIAEKYK